MLNHTVGLSEYDNQWCQRIVDSGIRRSKMRVVSEALAQTRGRFERELEEALQLKAEIKERREARRQT